MAVNEELTEEINTAVEEIVEEQTSSTNESDEAGSDGQGGVSEEASQGSDDGGSEEGEGTDKGDAKSGGDEEGAGEGTSESEGAEQKEAIPVISDEALTLAVQAGMSAHVARSFSNDEDLLEVIEVVKGAGELVEPEPEAAPDPLDAIPDLDPEQYDEKAIAQFAAYKDILRKQQTEIAELREGQASAGEIAQQTSRAASDREIKDWFEDKVQKLNETLGDDTLGAGDYGSLERGGPQVVAREKLARQTAVLVAGYEATGHQSPPREEIFDSAARLVFGDKYRALHEKDISDKLGKRAGQHVRRVGGKTNNTNSQDPMEETAALIDAKFFSGD